jgi:hypothetical protein
MPACTASSVMLCDTKAHVTKDHALCSPSSSALPGTSTAAAKARSEKKPTAVSATMSPASTVWTEAAGADDMAAR